MRIMESIPVNGEVGGAGGAYSYNALKTLDDVWSSICSSLPGISIATALSCKGLRVGIVEKSVLRGVVHGRAMLLLVADKSRLLTTDCWYISGGCGDDDGECTVVRL
ncbi:hypothetical protein PHJA_001311700 [Phtheirospermum japonicum]|uniref:Uncharacterized protein n=1 Tax=Phtheirospermum japonicum TaxID=374723 RepID=A0A830BUN3_9LAMI|nr:hypothetical protein PHJA_001311700 [Phtheirospermum japonicum]